MKNKDSIQQTVTIEALNYTPVPGEISPATPPTPSIILNPGVTLTIAPGGSIAAGFTLVNAATGKQVTLQHPIVSTEENVVKITGDTGDTGDTINDLSNGE